VAPPPGWRRRSARPWSANRSPGADDRTPRTAFRSPRAREPLAKQPDRVLVRRAIAQPETQEAKPAQALPDEKLHALVAHGRQDQHLEHRHRIARRPATLRALRVTQPDIEHGPECFEIDNSIQCLERITRFSTTASGGRESQTAPQLHLAPQTREPSESFQTIMRHREMGGLYICKCWPKQPQRFTSSTPSNSGTKHLGGVDKFGAGWMPIWVDRP